MDYFLLVIICAASSVFLGAVFIPLFKRLSLGQPILKYVETHKGKSGTPTMGGLFFILPSVVIFFAFKGGGKVSAVSAAIGVAFMLVGFIDDFLKIRYKENKGLKAYQKIIFLLFIAVFCGLYAYRNGLTYFFIPFYKGKVDLGIWTVFLVIFIFVAITNSVNLTDGLDSLAGGTSLIYLIALAALIFFEESRGFGVLNQTEWQDIIRLCFALIGGIAGFLLFNCNPAKVFMGDTGSLALGGFLGALSVFSGNAFFIPLVGIMFVWSSISVILQVAHFKRTKNRIFLMAPYHHHLQMKGVPETRIAFIYAFITALVGGVLIAFYV